MISLFKELHLRATECTCHLLSQFYLSPNSSEHTPSETGCYSILPTLNGQKAKLT